MKNGKIPTDDLMFNLISSCFIVAYFIFYLWYPEQASMPVRIASADASMQACTVRKLHMMRHLYKATCVASYLAVILSPLNHSCSAF